MNTREAGNAAAVDRKPMPLGENPIKTALFYGIRKIQCSFAAMVEAST
jgi:hypothetical protein